VLFQDFPGPGIFKKKNPGLSRRRGNPVYKTTKPETDFSCNNRPKPTMNKNVKPASQRYSLVALIYSEVNTYHDLRGLLTHAETQPQHIHETAKH